MEHSTESSKATLTPQMCLKCENWFGIADTRAWDAHDCTPYVSDRQLLEALSTQVTALQTQVDGLLALLHEYGDQLAPTLDSIAKGPIGKLLGMGK